MEASTTERHSKVVLSNGPSGLTLSAMPRTTFERIVVSLERSMTELSVVEQIRAFSGARFILGIHGAALTNIVFAPYDAAILVVTSAAIERMDNFRRIAASMGQTMTTIVSDRFDGTPDSPNADYRVDVDAIVGAAREMLA